MNTFTHDSIVNSQEAEALKEMIFKRARERAVALTSEVQESYTTSVQNDVMDLARSSFVATKNPFSLNNTVDSFEKSNNDEEKTPTVMSVEENLDAGDNDGLGFSKKRIENIKNQIVSQSKIANKDIAKTAVEENMTDARDDFKSRSTFMGALNFLNSQASISLVRSKGKSFDAIA